MATARGLARRASWNLIDQGMSALSNMLLMIVVAQAIDDATAFGAFAIAFLIYGVAVAVSKAMVGQPLQMRHSADTPERFREVVRTSQGTAAWLGVVGGIGCAIAAVIIGGPVGAALLALAPCLPALVMQDALRMAFFASGRAEFAALIDFVRMVMQFGLLFGAILLGWTSVGLLTLTWGIAGLVSAVVGLVIFKAAPSLLGSRVWIRDQRDITGYLLAEYLLGLGAAQFGILLIAPLASPADVGAIRAVQTLLGPLNVLGTAALAFAIPEISRRAHMRAPARIKAMGAVSGAMALVSTAYVVTLWLLPDPVGEWLFRDSWSGAAPVLVPMGINSIASALAVGAAVTLYGMGLAKKTFHLNILRAPFLLGLMIYGTLELGALGAGIALAVTETLFVPFWIITAWRASVRRDRERDAAAAEEAEEAGMAREGDDSADAADDEGDTRR